MTELKITSGNFENEVMKSDIPVLIDFWASWCAPCKMMLPVVAQLAEEYAGKVKVGKVNVDEEPELARQFQVMSIPMFAVVKDGKVVNKMIGARPKSELEAMLR
ncbi:MAG: thioredoxin [Lachnospiraceae bacterium]